VSNETNACVAIVNRK